MQEFITIPTYLIREFPQDKLYALMDILSMADENGEFYSTTRKLMDRWKWGSGKTVSFLKELEERNIIGTQTERKRNTLISINKEFLEVMRNANGTQTERKRNAKKTENPTEDTEIYKRIIEHLNMVCGTRYKHTTTGNVKDIKSRLKEEYAEEDFYTVIDKKAKEWLGTECEKYLRPSTLFGNKFGEYLNQKIVKEQKQGEIDILDEWRNS